MRSSNVTRIRRAKRKRPSVKISTCEQTCDPFFLVTLKNRGCFVYTGISRRSPYGFRIGARLWHDLGGSLALRVLRVPRRRLSTFSHLHRRLCLLLLLLRRPRLLINPYLDLNALVPAIQFPRATLRFSPNHVFRSLLSRTILISLSLSRFGPRCPRLAVILRSQTCASLALEATGLFILRISGSTYPHRLRSLLCPLPTSALILVLPPGVAGS